MFLSFAGIALLLAAVGLYGVLSYSVARRQREIGVLRAIGATHGRLVAMIVKEGITVTVLGLAHHSRSLGHRGRQRRAGVGGRPQENEAVL